MKRPTLYSDICYAIDESMILEMAIDREDEEYMLLNAVKLSGASWDTVTQVYQQKYAAQPL